MHERICTRSPSHPVTGWWWKRKRNFDGTARSSIAARNDALNRLTHRCRNDLAAAVGGLVVSQIVITDPKAAIAPALMILTDQQLSFTIRMLDMLLLDHKIVSVTNEIRSSH